MWVQDSPYRRNSNSKVPTVQLAEEQACIAPPDFGLLIRPLASLEPVDFGVATRMPIPSQAFAPRGDLISLTGAELP
jgi:hypothetical protein